MALDCFHLDLTSYWADDGERDAIVVVRKVDGLRLTKGEGYKKVAAGVTIARLRRMSEDLAGEMRDFLAGIIWDQPGMLARGQQQVVQALAGYIKREELVGLRPGGVRRWGDDPNDEERRLVREIERETRGWLWDGGRKYKLVAGPDLDATPARDSFEVVRHREARDVVKSFMAQYLGKGEAARKLNEARSKLALDWRPPLQPKGIVLLRRIAAKPVASVQPAAVLTPSQMQALREAKSHEFVWDPPWSQRQWVNLPKSWGVVAFGDTATLSGHVEPREAGQVVTFTLLPDPMNPPEATGAALETTTATSDAQGKVQIEMAFPIYPGAKFKIAAKTASMAAPVESEPITVWRRVYYQITTMDPAPDGTQFNPPVDMISALEAAFNPVWIELAAGTKGTATTPYKAHLTNAERYAVENSLRASSVDNRSPYKMNIVMIDTADIVAVDEWKLSMTGPHVETPPFTKWIHDPTLISADYALPALGWSPLADVQVVDVPPYWAKITATIPGSPLFPVWVRIKYRFQRGYAAGWGGPGGAVFMCIGRERRKGPAVPTGSELQHTLTHEIGHALNLVPETAPWHDPDARDAEYVVKHCGSVTATKQPRCVMWWEGAGSGERLRFCNHNPPNDCAHFLLRADLSNIRWI